MMRKLFTVLGLYASFLVFAQDAKTLRLGIQLGFHGAASEFAGGSPNAHARFENRGFGGGAITLSGRYDLNHRWMLQSGLGISGYGFEFALSENYSLLARERAYTKVRNEFCMLEVPVMAFYKFSPNCKNVRWLIGGGMAFTFTGAQSLNDHVSMVTDASNIHYLSSSAQVNGGAFTFLRWSVAREKTYRNGSILQLSLVVNAGFRRLAEADVQYTIDNATYSHIFRTEGDFAGLRLAYFLKPRRSA